MTTLPQQDTIIQYVGNGIVTAYVVPFYTPLSSIDNSPAIDVYVTLSGQPAIPADDLKVWPTDFTYAPNVDPTTGGVLTFTSGSIPPLSSIITFSRDVPAELTSDFSDAQNFSGANLDNALFSLLLIEQQNKTYALQRNLSYVVNSFLPSNIVQANTQIPLLANNQIWKGQGGGVIATTLEENPDTSTLRSDLANASPGTDGSTIVGYYDSLGVASTTVHNQLNVLTGNIHLFGTDTGSVNALVLTLAGNVSIYTTGMQIRIYPANTNTGSATLNLNSLGAKAIYRNASVQAQPGDLIAGQLTTLVYDGSHFVIQSASSLPSGAIIDFGGSLQPGFLLCDGSAVSRVTYAALFAAISTTWGVGDGSTTFNVPDLRRSVTMGSGGSGTAIIGNAVGNKGGEEAHVQTLAEMAAHSHPPQAGENIFVTGASGGGNSLQNTGGSFTFANTAFTGIEGSSSPFNVIQPSAIVTKMIKI